MYLVYPDLYHWSVGCYVMVIQGCAQDDLSGGYLLAQVEQNLKKCKHFSTFYAQMTNGVCKLSLSDG